MKESSHPNNNLGPESYENWKKWRDNHDDWLISEYPLFSDAHITGDLSDIPGPYQLINMVPVSLGECMAPTVMLRIAHPQGMIDVPNMTKTDNTRFHGGTLKDEIAALLSLHLGVRFKAGGLARFFLPQGDPRGRPQAFEMISDPTPPRYLSRPVIPGVLGKHSLNKADLFPHLIKISAADAIVLIRASRMYQGALWICESQPALAWLFLVSSIETAANHWRKKQETPEDRLRASKPELETLLRKTGGETLISKVAIMIADYMGATKKFIDFIMRFLPEPPDIRPPDFAQLNWEKASVEKALKKIYDYRSKALHNGTPFPLPMCDPPMKHENKFEEKPFARAYATAGGVWVADDLPMSLNTFEYIARNSLLNWWRFMVKRKEDNTESNNPQI